VRVVHVIGSEGAAYRLHVGLRRLGVDSRMLVAESRTDGSDPAVVTFRPPMDPLSRLRRRLRSRRIGRSMARYRATRPEGYGYFFDDRNPHGAEMVGQLPPCDVVHLHTMSRLVSFDAFFPAVPRRIPVVRTLHDMSFFTGGCHHDWGCGKYTDRCGACPQLGSHDESDLSRQIWERKRAALRAVPRGRLHFAAPSRWLAETARRSALLRDIPIAVIPLALDTDVFSPRDRRFARQVLGIPQHAAAVLFIADPVARPEKGARLLVQALERLSHLEDLVFVSVGSGEPPCEVPVTHLRLGRIANERMLSLVYSAVDVCAIPSVQDNFPYAALESLACGTPVVGFAVGGLPEIVRTGLTGVLVPPRDCAALAAAIGDLLGDPVRRAAMSASCRAVATAEYRLELQAQRYLALYEEILGTERARASTGSRGDGRRHAATGADAPTPAALDPHTRQDARDEVRAG